MTSSGEHHTIARHVYQDTPSSSLELCSTYFQYQYQDTIKRQHPYVFVHTVHVLNFVVHKFSWILWYPPIYTLRKSIPSILDNNCTYYAAMTTKINGPQIFLPIKNTKIYLQNLIRIRYASRRLCSVHLRIHILRLIIIGGGR